jgi:hypothetical protein
MILQNLVREFGRDSVMRDPKSSDRITPWQVDPTGDLLMAFEIDELPPTDLERLRVEVLDRGPVAALPSELSDEWLALIVRDLEFLDRLDDDTEETTMAAPLALVLKILLEKSGGNEQAISYEQMFQHFQSYRIEIGLEMVRRHSNIKAEPATQETIFTDRHLDVTNEGLASS